MTDIHDFARFVAVSLFMAGIIFMSALALLAGLTALITIHDTWMFLGVYALVAAGLSLYLGTEMEAARRRGIFEEEGY